MVGNHHLQEAGSYPPLLRRSKILGGSGEQKNV